MFGRFILVVMSVPLIVFGIMTCWEAIDIGLLTDPGPAGPFSFGSKALVAAFGWSHSSQTAFLLSGLAKGLSMIAVGAFCATQGISKRVTN